jgi:hypothetical protein
MSEMDMTKEEPPSTYHRESFPHLSDAEWAAIQELFSVLGAVATAAFLADSSPLAQEAAVRGYMLQKRASSAGEGRSLKIDVSAYGGGENENLQL